MKKYILFIPQYETVRVAKKYKKNYKNEYYTDWKCLEKISDIKHVLLTKRGASDYFEGSNHYYSKDELLKLVIQIEVDSKDATLESLKEEISKIKLLREII